MVMANIVQSKQVCQNRKIEGEDGVVLMRHMEAYMGDEPEKWDCGLGGGPQIFAARCKDLRTKYLAKLMLSDFNMGKPLFLVEYDKFGKMEKFLRMKKVNEMLEKINVVP